ncbi:YceH family protein [Mucilaginibacter sp. UR6-1]|uniref:YceH family protein n=1 Tax=Mucilaginibacter sp. UR6-1 TaxID=1435643 RepID=UPI001E50CD49|nr:YceH family protein [Mucilaginibacter sp. UR6-1]MCC8409225.1 YceH family protein [Mucilaginibacter sp. UR6-1]
MEQPQTLPVLTDTELRVLGALIEKSRTTPEYYPLTLNSLTTACNQKTARKPVVEYDDDTVIAALDSLKKRALISTVVGGSSRATKYKHNFAVVYPLIPAEVVVIGLLILRGPQTPGEINTNSGRMYEFESLEEVQEILDKLSSGDTIYIQQLPKRPGQKEVRYTHLLAGEVDVNAFEEAEVSSSRSSSSGALEARVATLEQELAELKENFNKLMKELMG